jgi:hypothetical protein
MLGRMAMSIHDQVVEGLQRWKGRWEEVSQATGVPLRTLEKVARREYKSHRLSTMEPLHIFLTRHLEPPSDAA